MKINSSQSSSTQPERRIQLPVEVVQRAQNRWRIVSYNATTTAGVLGAEKGSEVQQLHSTQTQAAKAEVSPTASSTRQEHTVNYTLRQNMAQEVVIATARQDMTSEAQRAVEQAFTDQSSLPSELSQMPQQGDA